MEPFIIICPLKFYHENHDSYYGCDLQGGKYLDIWWQSLGRELSQVCDATQSSLFKAAMISTRGTDHLDVSNHVSCALKERLQGSRILTALGVE